jgi:hypothetical protein
MTMVTIDAFAHLLQSLADLDDVLAELALLAGDVPEPDDEPAIVDALRDRIIDLRGDVSDASGMLRGGDPRAALASCHERFNAIARAMASELGSRAHVIEIVCIASDRGGAWIKWSSAVQHGLDRCTVANDTVAAALLESWRGLATTQSSHAA